MSQLLEERQKRLKILSSRIPVGIENFAELTSHIHNRLFVDRTQWLKDLLCEGAKVVAFHSFRRSGKSLTASMIEHFFGSHVAGQSTQGLFDALEIGQQDPKFVTEHQGKYPVISLTLKSIQNASYQSSLKTFALIIQGFFKKYPFLENSPHLSAGDRQQYCSYAYFNVGKDLSSEALAESLRILSDLLFIHYGQKNKVMIVIDEYDAPMAAAARHGYLDAMTSFLRQFLGSALKTNDRLEKGFLFGVLRISRESLLSDLNNPRIYTLFDQGAYEPYFGFTEEEVKKLIKLGGFSEKILPDIKFWYDGYNVGSYSLYNPYSVMSYLRTGGDEPRSFWTNTASDDLLKNCFLNANTETKDKIRHLLDGQKVVKVLLNQTVRFEDVETDADALWSLMYNAGYLTAAQPLEPIYADYQGYVRIPNHEVRGVYLKTFAQWFNQEVVTRGSSIASFYKAIDEGNAEALGKYLGNFLMVHTSYHNFQEEDSYHSLLVGLTAGLYETHIIFSDTEAGHGRADLLIIPRESYQKSNEAWVIEFKKSPKILKSMKKEKEISLAENLAKEALGQIDTQAYQTFLKKFPHISRVLLVGLGFAKKQLAWAAASRDFIVPASKK